MLQGLLVIVQDDDCWLWHSRFVTVDLAARLILKPARWRHAFSSGGRHVAKQSLLAHHLIIVLAFRLLLLLVDGATLLFRGLLEAALDAFGGSAQIYREGILQKLFLIND